MNRLFLARHGGSTGNEDNAFYAYNDSAICLTSNGVRQALSTGDLLAHVGGPLWLKPGNFDLEVYASAYTRAQQTARICLDQIGILSVAPKIRALLNERNYGSKYDPKMDQVADCDANDSESAIRARVRIRGFIEEIEPVLERADVVAFSHMGTLRALIANLRGVSDDAMMHIDVPNGETFLFVRSIAADGTTTWREKPLPSPVIPKSVSFITLPTVGMPRNLR